MDKHKLLNEYAIIKRQQLESSPYSCLDNDRIDLNPHQIEALMFAVEALKLGGAILATRSVWERRLKPVWSCGFYINMVTGKCC